MALEIGLARVVTAEVDTQADDEALSRSRSWTPGSLSLTRLLSTHVHTVTFLPERNTSNIELSSATHLRKLRRNHGHVDRCDHKFLTRNSIISFVALACRALRVLGLEGELVGLCIKNFSLAKC